MEGNVEMDLKGSIDEEDAEEKLGEEEGLKVREIGIGNEERKERFAELQCKGSKIAQRKCLETGERRTARPIKPKSFFYLRNLH